MNKDKESPFTTLLLGVVSLLLIGITTLLVIRLTNSSNSPEESSAEVIPTNRSCNQTCSPEDGFCVSGFSCINGFCRNPACTNEIDCICNVEEEDQGNECNSLCGGSYGFCVTDLECVDSDGNSAISEIGRCRNPVCPKDLGCTCD